MRPDLPNNMLFLVRGSLRTGGGGMSHYSDPRYQSATRGKPGEAVAEAPDQAPLQAGMGATQRTTLGPAWSRSQLAASSAALIISSSFLSSLSSPHSHSNQTKSSSPPRKTSQEPLHSPPDPPPHPFSGAGSRPTYIRGLLGRTAGLQPPASIQRFVPFPPQFSSAALLGSSSVGVQGGGWGAPRLASRWVRECVGLQR
jgi:hypothetical protein